MSLTKRTITLTLDQLHTLTLLVRAQYEKQNRLTEALEIEMDGALKATTGSGRDSEENRHYMSCAELSDVSLDITVHCSQILNLLENAK